MKKNAKLGLFKNTMSNELVFYMKLYNKNRKFFIGLNMLFLKYAGKNYEPKPFSSLEDEIKFFKKREIINDYYKKLVGKKFRIYRNFLQDIKKFLYKNDLGQEWVETIFLLIATGYLLTPKYNFHLGYVGEDNKKIRVFLELNPDTSIDDIKAGWSEIKAKQKKSYPTYRSIKLTKKSFKIFNIAINDQLLSYRKKTDDEAYKGMTDLDRVGRFWPENGLSIPTVKEDKKKRANLRKIRSRFGRDKM